MKRIIFLAILLATFLMSSCTNNQREGWKKRFGKDEDDKKKQSEAAKTSPDKLEFNAEKQKLIGIETIEVKRQVIKDIVELPAEIIPDPNKVTSVIAPVSGKVTSVQVNIGSPVESGTELAVIEDPQNLGQKFTAVSPIKGIVIERPVNASQWIESGKEIARIVDYSTLVVLIRLYPDEQGKVKVGQEVSIKSDNISTHGKISFISPDIDPATRTVETRAEILNPEGKLKANAYATASIIIGSKEALVIPEPALLSEESNFVVYINKGNSFEKRIVTVGVKYHGLAEITSGLNQGDIVVTKGAYQLKNAQFSSSESVESD